MVPAASRKRFGISVILTASAKPMSPASTSLNPGTFSMLSLVCSEDLRMSQSISSTRTPVWAMVMARLVEMVDFPSPGKELVKTSTRLSRLIAEK